MLMALSDRQELLANEDLVGFLRDASAAVRTAAETVLTTRGLSAEQIALAKRATDPSPLVRAQASRHIAESDAVDRVVWLSHLSRDTVSAVRAEAARALALVGSEECLERLSEMANADPDTQIRQLCSALQSDNESKGSRQISNSNDDSPMTLPTIRTPTAN
jgi:HEAT repeat protein